MFEKIKQLLGILPSRQAEEVFMLADRAAMHTVKRVDQVVMPVRRSILHRFPVLFALLVTVGAAAVILGIEQLILKYQIFDNHPELIFLSGVIILAFTGKLHKKLSE